MSCSTSSKRSSKDHPQEKHDVFISVRSRRRHLQNLHKPSLCSFNKDWYISKHELLKILECKKKQEQMVVPVFYDDVDPSSVRREHEIVEEIAKTVLEKLDRVYVGDLDLQIEKL
ncbi:hypothetical protein K1719_017127 [Acacia pycnantha]|nr:hypothetical protein K1719_017127 [Acacia pycnantha]